MGRVKVEGYFEPDDDEFDPDHETGLNEEAYEKYSMEFTLEELTFTRVDD